jgi:6-phospho-beta-glucosidase
MKITIFGGGGVRTPLIIYGLAQARRELGVEELCLCDPDLQRTESIARIGREIVRRLDGGFAVRVQPDAEAAADRASFVLNSIRVGGMERRARDERIAIEHGLAGQETTGPGGAAMALRSLPVSLAYARLVERVAPGAWFINFSNPAGLMTQALTQHSGVQAIGICDTPSELFFRISEALGEPLREFQFDYAGLNHLGWVRRVTLRGEDITPRILDDEALLPRLYPSGLFDPALIRTLRLIPTEYLFFYYCRHRAYENQLQAGASRGEELVRLNRALFEELGRADAAQGLEAYRRYLLRRNSSYLKLEAQAESAFETEAPEYDVFETATGYHRIALDVMTGLAAGVAREVVLNVPNRGAIDGLEDTDVVEVPCEVDRSGARPRVTGGLPLDVRGLVEAVKQYERTLIRASLCGSAKLARVALTEYPLIGDWELAGRLLDALRAEDAEGLGYLK